MAARALGVAPSAAASMRRWMARPPAIPLVLGVGAFILAFVQRSRARSSHDSRVELTLDPAIFLHQIAAVWSGDRRSRTRPGAQFVGYLFPMGPLFAGANASASRSGSPSGLWMGPLLALAAWGAIRVMDELCGRRRGDGPFGRRGSFSRSTRMSSRSPAAQTSRPARLRGPAVADGSPRIAGWPTAALALAGDWRARHRLRRRRGQRRPAAWIIAAPVALIVYEGLVLRDAERRAYGLSRGGPRCARCSPRCGGSFPSRCKRSYGADFLSFIEQPQSIWATTSMSESLRLLGYWIFYFGTASAGSRSRPSSPRRRTSSTAGSSSPPSPSRCSRSAGCLLARWRFAPFFVGWSCRAAGDGRRLPPGQASRASPHLALLPRGLASSRCEPPTRRRPCWRWPWPV